MLKPSEKMKSLKELILGNQLLIDLIRKEKKEIEKNYGEQDKVKEEFLFTMLSKGYIDENYSDFLSASYEEQFTNDEHLYIQNLREEKEPDFNLKIEHIHSVERKILPYKWTNASVLNNDILSDILNNNQSEKIEQFIIAIINYCNLYKKNNFLEQYVVFINNEEKKDLFLDVFLEKLAQKIDSGSLSIFNKKTESLFCKMISKKIDDSIINSCGNIIEIYLENNIDILEELLKNAIRDFSLKEKIIKINPIIKNLSDFKDLPEIQQLLIDEALFQISKQNLDFILEQSIDSHFDYGYEYFKHYDNIWKKIIHPNKINFFIENILLTDNELHYSPFEIVEILFNEKVKIENVKKIIEKLKDESIELEVLPKFFKIIDGKLPEYWSNIVFELLNQNKLYLNFNNILYVYKSYIKGLIPFVQKVIKRLNLSTKNKSIKLEKTDDFLKTCFLQDFFDMILVTPKIDDDLFEKISDIMIYQHLNIIELTTHAIDFLGDISTTKTQILVKQIFKNSIFNNDSINNFINIISHSFGNFYQNFEKIKDKCINDWNCKKAWISLLSILLENKNIIHENDKIESLMKEITLNDFDDVIKEWKEKSKLDASNNIRNILTLNNLDILIKKFGRSTILEFLDNYEESLDNYIVNNIKEIIEKNFSSSADQEPVEIEKNHTKNLFEIVEKYKIPPRAIFEHRIKLKTLFEPLTSLLQNESIIELNWNSIIHASHIVINSKPFLINALATIKKNPESSMAKKMALLSLPKNSFRSVFKNDLFIIGRYFYNAIEKKQFNVDDFISYENNDLLKISSIWSLHPLLSGAIFEGFFDNEGNFKTNTTKNNLYCLLKELIKDKNSMGYEFIRDCLKPFRTELNSITIDIFNF